MPILFSAVAHNRDVVSKYASCDGNFGEIVQLVMSKIPNKDHKMTYSHGPYLFNYIAEDGYLYFCITARACQRSRAFLYLNEIKRRFSPDNKEFYHVLASEMQRYSEDYSTIVVRKGEIDELNSIGVDSSESILGEKQLSVDNPDSLCFSTSMWITKTPQKSVTSEDLYEYEQSDQPNVYPCVSKTPQDTSKLAELRNTEEIKQVNVKYFLIFVTVILFIIWISFTQTSPVSLGIVALVLMFSFTRLSKVKDKTI